MAGHNIWDYVIIGGGSAGCVVANRLSADETARCLLLEAGGEDWSPFIQVPAGLTILSRKYDWSYEAEPDQSRGGVVDNWAAGKVLGGGSSINAMLWVRGHRGDFDHWQELGCDGWRYDDVLPYFVKAETFEDIESEFRGSKGPQHVSHVRSPQPMTDAFIEAALEQGFEAQDDYNGAIQEGVTEAQLSQKKGLRHSTARAYLSPARRRRNLSLRKHSFVTRVLFEGRRAIGVEYIYRGRTRRVFADREVILCAGAFGSPKILMLSGIGPADQLRSFGISVVLNSPGVGQNLQEHPCVRMVYLVDARTLNRELNPRGVIRHGADFLFRRRGAATSAIAHALLFFSLQDSNRWTDVQVIFSPFGISGANGDSSASDSAAGGYRHDVHDMRLMDTAAVMAYPCLLHPDSRGTVQLRSADPTDYPVIQHSLLGESKDVEMLIAASARTRSIFETNAFRPHLLKEQLPGERVQTESEWRRFVQRTAFRSEHPVGTCRMGIDPHSVVDPYLRVHGVDGLRVIDASVMPTLTSGNTNAPTIMIAEKGSDLVRFDNARSTRSMSADNIEK